MNYVRFLAWIALMADLVIAMGSAIANANSGTFEVDLISPRNETYTPQALMPIVFALQSPPLAFTLEAAISWELWEGNNRSSPGSVTDGLLELGLLNLTSSEPHFVTRFINTLAYPDGFWTFVWSLQIYKCSQGEGSTQRISTKNTTIFTVSQSGQAPNLVATTSSEMCGTMEAYAFNVTSKGDTCGVLGPSPTTNQCAATINPSAASSIYAAATAFACDPLQRPVNPNVTCPHFTGKSPNDAGQSRMAAASTLLLLLTMVTALFHLG
ncbi:SSCRP protein [Penicillium digitatum]|uniref:DUF7136 domain-containing protein n=3 Tax=Penicillium digitatum TaxID=36651 RepID=K9G0N0_PEND2|nr:hypothetical protein PDIP_59720 [Penicillium digitatum Pd1]EKV10554.1 hypothetical protein PDIP_59720 [Penicillium digitatum Pd1]EKV15530.1 hypothetical protein PDIG_25230 [Penicillium digitatum PHI26]KAG0157516.1 hypothetical protein PDIDSM_4701 [Penicillium digitatum]QQK44151.1 SSCRP protein [Penicillium digitatum]